jgi:hypothetical protein
MAERKPLDLTSQSRSLKPALDKMRDRNDRTMGNLGETLPDNVHKIINNHRANRDGNNRGRMNNARSRDTVHDVFFGNTYDTEANGTLGHHVDNNNNYGRGAKAHRGIFEEETQIKHLLDQFKNNQGSHSFANATRAAAKAKQENDKREGDYRDSMFKGRITDGHRFLESLAKLNYMSEKQEEEIDDDLESRGGSIYDEFGRSNHDIKTQSVGNLAGDSSLSTDENNPEDAAQRFREAIYGDLVDPNYRDNIEAEEALQKYNPRLRWRGGSGGNIRSSLKQFKKRVEMMADPERAQEYMKRMYGNKYMQMSQQERDENLAKETRNAKYQYETKKSSIQKDYGPHGLTIDDNDEINAPENMWESLLKNKFPGIYGDPQGRDNTTTDEDGNETYNDADKMIEEMRKARATLKKNGYTLDGFGGITSPERIGYEELAQKLSGYQFDPKLLDAFRMYTGDNENIKSFLDDIRMQDDPKSYDGHRTMNLINDFDDKLKSGRQYESHPVTNMIDKMDADINRFSDNFNFNIPEHLINESDETKNAISGALNESGLSVNNLSDRMFDITETADQFNKGNTDFFDTFENHLDKNDSPGFDYKDSTNGALAGFDHSLHKIDSEEFDLPVHNVAWGPNNNGQYLLNLINGKMWEGNMEDDPHYSGEVLYTKYGDWGRTAFEDMFNEGQNLNYKQKALQAKLLNPLHQKWKGERTMEAMQDWDDGYYNADDEEELYRRPFDVNDEEIMSEMGYEKPDAAAFEQSMFDLGPGDRIPNGFQTLKQLISLDAIRTWKDMVLPQFRGPTIFSNTPANEKLRSIYQRMGFGGDGTQYGFYPGADNPDDDKKLRPLN